MIKSGRAVFFLLALCFLLPAGAQAMPEYSRQTGEGCRTCHKSIEEGTLTDTGIHFAASGYSWPPEGGFRVLGPIKKSVRYLIGFFHVTASFLWFGTILYVHLLLRPAYASKGLPRGEALTGLASMGIVGISGFLLTISRVNGLEVLTDTHWGRLLGLKILCYIIMTGSAVFVLTMVGPRLRRDARSKTKEEPRDGIFNSETLAAFDGSQQEKVYFAYEGKVYDASGLKMWKDGKHIKHQAGGDLTPQLPKAPHGPEKLEGLRVAGSYDAEHKPPLAWYQRAFYVIAYVNLGMVFAVLLIISYWRWG